MEVSISISISFFPLRTLILTLNSQFSPENSHSHSRLSYISFRGIIRDLDSQLTYSRRSLLGTVQLHKAESFVCDKVNERGDHFYFQCPFHTYNFDIMDRMDNMRSTSSIYSVIIGGRLENDHE